MSRPDVREIPTVGGDLAAVGKTFGAAAGISALGATVEYASPVVARLAHDATGLFEWVPAFGSLGETVLVYSTVSNVVGPLATVLLAVAFGYAGGGRFAVETDYRWFVGTVTLGSLSAVTVVFAALVTTSGGATSLDARSLLIVAGFYLRLVVDVAAVVVAGALAGAALAQFGE